VAAKARGRGTGPGRGKPVNRRRPHFCDHGI